MHPTSSAHNPFKPHWIIQKFSLTNFGDTRFSHGNSNLWLVVRVFIMAGFMFYCKMRASSLLADRYATVVWSLSLHELVMNLWTFLSAVPRQHSNTQTATHASSPAETALSACFNHAVQLKHVFPLCTLRMMSHPQSHVLPKYGLI